MGALGHRDFRLLFLGQTISLFGDGLFFVALAFAVLDATHSNATLGLVFAAGSVPLVALVLLGGVVADRRSRRGVMLAADLARMAIQIVLAAAVVTHHATTWVFVALFGAYGVGQAFFSPASTGLVPQILPPAALQQANGLLGMTRSVMGVAGGALGGVLVTLAGPGWVIGFDALTFAASAAALGLLRSQPPPPPPAGEATSYGRELAAGLREVRSRRWVWLVISGSFVFLMLYVAPFEVVGPIVSRDQLGGAWAWGLISASFAGGMALGGLFLTLVQLRRPMLVAGALFLVAGCSPLLLSIPAPLPVLCAVYIAEGLGAGLFLTTWETALQRDIPDAVLSRVSAWDWMGSVAGMPLGYALTGWVLATAGVRATLYGMAVCGVVTAVGLLASRDVREIGAPRVAVAGSAG